MDKVCFEFNKTFFFDESLPLFVGKTHSANECQSYCVQHDDCQFWTWQMASKRCYLRTATHVDLLKADHFVSGPRECSEAVEADPFDVRIGPSGGDGQGKDENTSPSLGLYMGLGAGFGLLAFVAVMSFNVFREKRRKKLMMQRRISLRQNCLKSKHLLSEEYSRLCTMDKAKNVNTRSYKVSQKNLTLNRHGTIKPYDENRVVLTKKFNEDGYINASWVETKLGRIIVAQSPLPNTVHHFWQMVLENNIPNIIYLKTRQDDKDCPFFWPSTPQETLHCDDLELSLTNQITLDNMERFQFQLKGDNKSLLATLHVFEDWKSKEPVPNSIEHFTAFILKMHELRNEIEERGLVVTCSDGAGKCGLFLASILILDELIFDSSIVSAYKITLNLRKYRTGMISSAEQFLFLNELVKRLLI